MEGRIDSIKLTKFQKEVLLGTLLGDAHARTYHRQRVTYSIIFEQGGRHEEYLYHLYDIFKNLCNYPPSQRTRVHTRLKKPSITWDFRTKSLVNLSFYGKYFYDVNKKKRIPLNIKRFLTPVVLAYWYMDDGSLQSSDSTVILLHTQCFSLKEVELLVVSLNLKFNLETKVRKHVSGYQIHISGKSSKTFSDIILPYIHSSMLYKMPKFKN